MTRTDKASANALRNFRPGASPVQLALQPAAIVHGIAWCACGRMLRRAGAVLRCMNGHQVRP